MSGTSGTSFLLEHFPAELLTMIHHLTIPTRFVHIQRSPYKPHVFEWLTCQTYDLHQHFHAAMQEHRQGNHGDFEQRHATCLQRHTRCKIDFPLLRITRHLWVYNNLLAFQHSYFMFAERHIVKTFLLRHCTPEQAKAIREVYLVTHTLHQLGTAPVNRFSDLSRLTIVIEARHDKCLAATATPHDHSPCLADSPRWVDLTPGNAWRSLSAKRVSVVVMLRRLDNDDKGATVSWDLDLTEEISKRVEDIIRRNSDHDELEDCCVSDDLAIVSTQQ